MDTYVAPHYSYTDSKATATPMSIYLSLVQDFSLLAAIKLALLVALGAGLLMLFKPLLLGCARAAVLVVKPKQSREQRLQRRQLATRA